MEALSYPPCSPLFSFPTQHEENSCLLWPPQLVSPHENATMYYDSNPFLDYRRQDREFLAMMDMDVVQDAEVLLQDGFPGARMVENCKLVVAAQEELPVMEESSLGDFLQAGAMAVEAGDLIHASAIMAKVDTMLDEGSSIDRLSWYFARGLRSRIAAARTECHPLSPQRAPANRLAAYQMVQEVSPLVKFAHFTANQAILEDTMDDQDVHVVDFNVGDGVQWSSLMSDLARDGGKPLRLTALTTAGMPHADAPAPGRWLSEFAESLGLPFRYDEEEDLHELCAKINRSQQRRGSSSSVIVSCDLKTMSRTSTDASQMLRLLLGSVKALRPKLVILTEDELFRVGREPLAHAGAIFGEALRHFAAVQESLASCFRGGGYEAGMRLVEEEILGPRIEGLSNGSMACGADADDVAFAFSGLGFRARRVSGFNVAQARMLAGLFSRGFGVVHDNARLALCWNDRPLTSVSVWSAS